MGMTDKMGGPAFPTPVADDRDCAGRFVSGYGGMTLWDYYAAAALQGFLASDREMQLSPAERHFLAAQEAADIADHMIAERAKRMEQGND